MSTLISAMLLFHVYIHIKELENSEQQKIYQTINLLIKSPTNNINCLDNLSFFFAIAPELKLILTNLQSNA